MSDGSRELSGASARRQIAKKSAKDAVDFIEIVDTRAIASGLHVSLDTTARWPVWRDSNELARLVRQSMFFSRTFVLPLSLSALERDEPVGFEWQR
jgi:hypothetical protein